ncbi:MAG TPA: zinc ribbon domain-containing protein [Methanoculleus sp.]|nr:zinc ribbon domain-containing protein [Methanoculleus sp.]
MTFIKCDICGREVEEGANYCNWCGADLRVFEETTPVNKQLHPEMMLEASKEKKFNKNLKRYTPCQLKRMPFMDTLYANILLLKGDALLTFCGCLVCNASYREIYTYLVHLAENRTSRPTDKEIAKRVREIDISASTFDFSFLSGMFNETKIDTEEEGKAERGYQPTPENRTISFELDASQLKEQIFRVWQVSVVKS